MALRPLLGTQKLYLKNSTAKLKNFTLEDNSILCSLHVVSMYLSFNVEKCKDISRINLQKHFHLKQEVTMASLEIEVIMKLVIYTNECSLHFGFRGEFYKQVYGLVMAASLSPLLENLFMNSIETSDIHSFRLSHCFWGRFMDDVVYIWKHGLK